MPTRTDPMRGRPIALEELERMYAKVPVRLTTRQRGGRVLTPHEAAVQSWIQLLEGLYWSGLRLAEALHLTWDDDSKIVVDLLARRPMLIIPPAYQKNHEFRITPIVPEFAEFLQRTPESDRTGYVFNPMPIRPERSKRLSEGRVGRIISDIGREANVVVKSNPVEFASAHDLRRSFGERWSHRVLPQTLMVLMRHASIHTTLTFYAGRNAEKTAEAVWNWFTPGSSPNGVGSPETDSAKESGSPTWC